MTAWEPRVSIFHENLHSLWHRFHQPCALKLRPCLYWADFCCCHLGIILIWENVIDIQKSGNTVGYSHMVTVVWLSQQHIDTHLLFHRFKRTNVFFLKVTSSSIANVSVSIPENLGNQRTFSHLMCVWGCFFSLIYEVLWASKLKSGVLVFHIFFYFLRQIYFIGKSII